MSQNAVTILMQTGLDKAVDAGAYPNFAIKYYLPIYDSRIDELIHSPAGTTGLTSAYAAIETSASVDSSSLATVLPADIEGQLLWGLPSTHIYQFDDTSDYQYSITPGQSSTTLSSPTQYIVNSKANVIKEISGGTISGIQENDTFSYKGSNVTGGSGTFSSTAAFVETAAYETNTTWDKTKLFDNVNYKGTSEDDSTVGVYSVEIQNKIPGNFKFNKLLVFIQKLNANGTEDTSNPIPFAMLTLSSTAFRTESINSSAAGINSFEAFFKMKFTATANAQMFVQDDQVWSLAPGSSAYGTDLAASINKDIYVLPTSGSNYDAAPLAKCHIISEPGKPILRGGRSKYVDHKGFILDLQDEHLLLYNEEALSSSSTILTSASIVTPANVKRSILRTNSITGIVEDSVITSDSSISSGVTKSVIVGNTITSTNVENSNILGNDLVNNDIINSSINADNGSIAIINLSDLKLRNIDITESDNSVLYVDNGQGTAFSIQSDYSFLSANIPANADANTGMNINNSFATINGSLTKFDSIVDSLLIGKFSATEPINIGKSNIITDFTTGVIINTEAAHNITNYLDILGTNNNINNSSVNTTYDRHITIRGIANKITGSKITMFGDTNEVALAIGDPAVSNLKNIFISGNANAIYNTSEYISIFGKVNTLTNAFNSFIAGHNGIINDIDNTNIIGNSNTSKWSEDSTTIGNSNNVDFNTYTSVKPTNLYNFGDTNTIENINTQINVLHTNLYNFGSTNTIEVDFGSGGSPSIMETVFNIGLGNEANSSSECFNIGIDNTVRTSQYNAANNLNIGFANNITSTLESSNFGYYNDITDSEYIMCVGKNNLINGLAKHVNIFGSNNIINGDHFAIKGITTVIGNYITVAEGNQTEPSSFSAFNNKTVFGAGTNNAINSTDFVDTIAFWTGERAGKARMIINVDNFDISPLSPSAGEVYLISQGSGTYILAIDNP